jgi:amino acid adenylation domain-containing protein
MTYLSLNIPYQIFKCKAKAANILIINPPGMSIKFWWPLISILRKTYTVIYVDYRMHNAPDILDTKTTKVQSILDDIIFVLDKYKFKKTHVITWCLGVKVGLELYRQYPKYIESLMPISISYTNEGGPYSAAVMEIKANLDKNPKHAKRLLGMVQTMKLMPSKVDLEKYLTPTDAYCEIHDLPFYFLNTPNELINYANTFYEFRQHNVTQIFKSLSDLPITLIDGEKNKKLPDLELNHIKGLVNLKYKVVDKGSHFVMLEYPEDVAEKIKAHIESPSNYLGELELIKSWQKAQYNNSSKLKRPELSSSVKAKRDSGFVYKGEYISYKALETAANNIIDTITKRNLASNVKILIFTSDITLEIITWICAIHRLGGSYLLLSPNVKKTHLRMSTNSSTIDVVLTTRRYYKEFEEVLSNENIVLLEQRKHERKLGYNTKNNPSLHKAFFLDPLMVQNYVNTMLEGLKLSSQDILLTFNNSMWELFLGRKVDAKVIFGSREDYLYPEKLSNIIRKNTVTVLYTTSLLLDELLSYFEENPERVIELESLNQVCCRYETISNKLTHRFYSLFDNTELFILYTPENLAIDLMYSKYRDNQPPVPVLINNIAVINNNNQQVPFEIPGELVLFGPHISPKSFPFHERKYVDSLGWVVQTKSLVVLTEGRSIELVRHMNDKKVNGHYIQNSEIENFIERKEFIRSCKVIQKNISGKNCLVAYFTSNKKLTATMLCRLKESIAKDVLEYKVPSFFIEVKSFPISPAGTIQGSDLPLPNLQDQQKPTRVKGLGSELHQKIRLIWENILPVKSVGSSDDFFKLGGNSLLAIQLINKIMHELNISLNFSIFFKNPSIDGIVKSAKLAGKQSEIVSNYTQGEKVALSFPQERFWFLQNFLDNKNLYKLSYMYKISGGLDINVFKKALKFMLDRHLGLGAEFSNYKGTPFVRYRSLKNTQVLFVAQMKSTEDVIIKKLNKYADQPFDISSRKPLIRVYIINDNKSNSYLLISMHHIISDGWGSSILLNELSEAYSAFYNKMTPKTMPLKFSIADYINYQHNQLSENMLNKGLTYWKSKLKGVNTRLKLPHYNGKNPHENTRNISLLSKTTTKNIKRACQMFGITPFMFLLSCFHILLKKYTTQCSAVVGVPFSNRDIPGAEHLVGCLINTLPIRLDFHNNDTFVSVLERLKVTLDEAYEHQNIPIEQIIKTVSKGRISGRTPLFQTIFSMQNFLKQDVAFSDSITTRLFKYETTPQIDLSMIIHETPNGFKFEVEYNKDIFCHEIISFFLDSYQKIIIDAIDNPKRHIKLNQLSKKEQALLAQWNQTQTEYPKDTCIHKLFETQVNKDPDKVALEYDGETLTYAELNQRINQFSHHLINHGLNKGDIISVILEPSIDLIISIFAILKAGGVYLPIDTQYPSDRISHILKDSHSKFIITHSSIELKSIDTISIIKINSDFSKNNMTPPKTNIVSSDPAYMIYTSGSTGKPKGTVVPHIGISNLQSFFLTHFHISDQDKVLQFSNIGFDASIWEVSMALLTGATLIIVPATLRKDLPNLDQFIDKNKISILTLPPNVIANLKLSNSSQAIRYLISAGSELSPQIYKEHLSTFSIINAYGPTETTICASVHFTNTERKYHRAIPIGKPISNTQVYILNNTLNPVPIGVPGELCIAGDGLSYGYINQSSLTADKFIPNPFSTTPGDRLYKTGDLARWLPDGNIEFIGRKDFQVKIRGFRIECGEIESALTKHPFVKEAHVLAKEHHKSEDKHLIAYFTSNNSTDSLSATLIDKLRNHLKQSLPDYMIPSFFVPLESFPLTPNGKIDRKALPEPDFSKKQKVYAMPQNEVQEKLAKIWQEVLKVDRVGIHDNFFELGGHSLMAVRLISKINNVYQQNLSVSKVFECPSIVEFESEMVNAEQSKSISIFEDIVKSLS